MSCDSTSVEFPSRVGVSRVALFTQGKGRQTARISSKGMVQFLDVLEEATFGNVDGEAKVKAKRSTRALPAGPCAPKTPLFVKGFQS
jgi:hypothetical protein